MRTKQEEIALINQKQDEYINELINFIETHREEEVISFTSPTGTGKTRMMDKLINSAFGQRHFFIIAHLAMRRVSFHAPTLDCQQIETYTS